MQHLIDPTDFCRKCRGSGTYGDDECFYCEGNGSRTVLISRHCYEIADAQSEADMAQRMREAEGQ